MMRACGFLFMMMFVPASAKALSWELGAGYGLLDLKNPDASTARSTGMGGTLGAYYSVFGNENYDFGIKSSLYYSQLKNDVNTAFLNEETEHYNLGLVLEFAVHDFFAGWQYKYNRIEIDLNGNLDNTSAFSDYMSQFELGYIFHMDAMQLRLVYQRTDGTLPAFETGLSGDTDFTSNAFMIILRWDFSPRRYSEDNTYRHGTPSTESNSRDWSRDRASENESATVPSYRSYRYAPRPSPNIR
jgi:hypothetical protein